MDIKVKKRIIGFLLLIGIILIVIPLFFSHSVPIEELKLAGHIPNAPNKPTNLTIPIPTTLQANNNKPPIVFEQLQSVANTSGDSTHSSNLESTANPSVATLSSALPNSLTDKHTPLLSSNQANISTKEETNFNTSPLTTVSFGATTSSQENVKSSESVTKVTSQLPVKTNEKTLKTSKTITHTQRKTSVTVLPVAQGWSVQLGSFTQKNNAEHLMKSLQAKGFTAYLRITKMADKDFIRVLVGPVIHYNEVVQLRTRLQQHYHLTGVIVKANLP